jgi:hypothetical protein
MKTSKILLWALGVVVIIGLIVAGAYLFKENGAENDLKNGGDNENADQVDISDWSTYRNEEYGFSLRYPGNWEVFEGDDDPVAVRFNIYDPITGEGLPPYDHHSQDVAHVSVFPQGVPTEGISGDSTSSNVSFGVEVRNDHDYLLADGSRFATQANFPSRPSSWNDSGFIFANTPVENLEVECLREGEKIPENECNPLMGDGLIRYGEIDEEMRTIQKAILESFDFIEIKDGGEENKDKEDLVRVSAPQDNAIISSPVTISGEAQGSWYFEATFPIRIEDANGNILASHYVTAQDEWMTEDFVEFEGEVSFDTPATDTGFLVLERANPSGLPENDDEVRIRVRFNSEDNEEERSISLYYYDPSLDEDEDGNIICSEQGLVAVEREIPLTQTPIQDAISLLLEGNIAEEEKDQGITTEYPLEGFSLEGASLNNGVLTLEFNDPENKTSGGSCRSGILWAQIKKTAEQFDDVEEVRFQPEELFQP